MTWKASSSLFKRERALIPPVARLLEFYKMIVKQPQGTRFVCET